MRVIRHLIASFRRSRLDDEMREELAQHAERKARQLAAEGLQPEEAHRQAVLAIGNATRLREDSRDIWGFPALDSVVQDVRYGLRQIVRSPAFSATAIASLAVGIGAGAAVFSLADAVLLRSLAVRDPGSVFVVKWRSGPVFPFSSLNGYGDQTAEGLASTSFSRAAYLSFVHDAIRYVDVLGFADLYEVNLTIDGRSEGGTAHAVSGNYFDLLGLQAAQGRTLGPMDDTPAGLPAAVISDRCWKRRFGGAPDALGRTLQVSTVPFTVVGIAPASFHGTGQVGSDPDVFIPLSLHARVMPNDDPLDDPNFWWVVMMARLKPGVHAEDARSALDVLLKRTVATARPNLAAADYPRVELLPGGRGQLEDRDGMRDPLRTMAFVTMVVLLVACANVAGLLLARGRARVRELSIRVAIGAPRRRVVRQLFIEALLVGLAGCALGVGIANWLSAALAPALSTGLEAADILARIDLRVLGFALGTACVCAVLFGVFPALRATDLTGFAGLQESGRGTIAGRGRRLLSSALVVAQIALSLLLVVSATLMVRTVLNLERVDLGFDPSNLLLFRIDPTLNGYNADRTTAFYARVLERLRGAPGVTAVTLSSNRLISNSASINILSRLDETPPEPGSAAMHDYGKTHVAWSLTVDDQFFQALGIRLLRGRSFVAADANGPRTALVNRALARQVFHTEDVVGRQVRLGTLKQTGSLLDIVGLVEDARYSSLRDSMPPTIYVYYRHGPPMKNPPTFEVRTSGSPAALVTTVREIVREIDPAVPVDRMMTQSEQIAKSLRQERLFARLATLLGAVALLLSGIGVYGLLAYTVARRTPEIGLRMALGAARGRVLWMVLCESLVLASAGLIVGVPVALAGTRVLRSLLYGLPPGDPATLAGAATAMLLLGAAAGYVPARSASRVDPLAALRAE
jgi:predicted permease